MPPTICGWPKSTTIWPACSAPLGRYKAAIDEYRRGAEICRAVKGPAAERATQVLATTLINTAMLYKSQRQFHEAARYCSEALEAQRSSADVEESSLVPFYSALASLYLAQDQAHPTGPAALSVDLSQAEQFTQQARDLCQKYQLLEQPAGIVVLQLEAMIHSRKGEFDSAEKGFQQALELANRARQASLAAKSLTYLAEIELRRGHTRQAADLAEQALKIHEQVQAYPNLRFMAYLTAARAAYALEHRDEAARLLERAIELVEAPRAATVGAESERAEYFSQFVAAFDLLVDWNVADGHYDVALHGAEQGRNRTFLDQVRAAGVDLRQSLRDTPQAELLTDERKILGEYQTALADLRKAYARTAPADEIKQTVARIETLKQNYAKIETDIRDASPIYRNLLGSSRGAGTWDEIAGPILAPHTALVLYYLGHAQSHLFVVDGDTHAIQYFPLDVSDKLADRIGFTPGPLTRAVAAELVTAYVETLRDRERSLPRRGISKKTVQSEKGDADLTGHQLTIDEQLAVSEILLPTAARDHIDKLGPRMVTVVPDGAIDQLPLEALLLSTEPARYLLDVFPPITYAPSATIMAMLTGRRPGEADGHASLLTVGNPTYAEPDALEGYAAEIATSSEYRTLGGLLTPLPGTMAECHAVEEAIATGAPGSDVVLLSGPAATEGNLRQKIVGRRFVHLAAHGLVDQRFGNLFGAIALSAPAAIASSTDDGFLSLYEIHNLSLPDCELMVLSSCETNVGADRPLEAGSTLARAFLAAGVRDVICSQWSVDDAASAALISDFFRNLSPQLEAKDSIDFATALRDASAVSAIKRPGTLPISGRLSCWSAPARPPRQHSPRQSWRSEGRPTSWKAPRGMHGPVRWVWSILGRNFHSHGPAAMRYIVCLAVCAVLPGCYLGHGPPLDARDVAVAYKQLRPMTAEPVYVDPGLVVLCVSPTAEQKKAARDASGPHAMTQINIYMNELAAEAFEKSSTPYAIDSIIVKEKWDGAVGGMIKRPAGYDPKHGDWEYFFSDPGGIKTGRIASCVQCHSAAASRDYVFGSWANGVTASTISTPRKVRDRLTTSN